MRGKRWIKSEGIVSQLTFFEHIHNNEAIIHQFENLSSNK